MAEMMGLVAVAVFSFMAGKTYDNDDISTVAFGTLALVFLAATMFV